MAGAVRTYASARDASSRPRWGPDAASVPGSRPNPTFNVTPSYYIKAAVAGGIVAIVSGIVWGVLVTLHLPFVPWLAAMGAGYAIGEAVSLASNRKRGQGLATLAGVCAGVATLTMFLASSASVFTLVLGALIAVYSAVYRVR